MRHARDSLAMERGAGGGVWRRAAVGVAVVLALGGVLVARWWLSYDAPPRASGHAGWTSDDLDWLTVRGIGETATVFHCEPGTLRTYLGLVAAPGERFSIDVESVSVPLLDTIWPELGWARRTATLIRRDPATTDYVDFTRATLDPDPETAGGYADLRLEWEITECPQMDGFTSIGSVDVTYRVLGRTRTDTVELAVPLNLTTQDLDALASQVGVVDRS